MKLLIKHFDLAYARGVYPVLHYYGTSPNKLTDYMLGAKPIIYSVDEPNALVERVGCGLCVLAEDRKKVAELL